MYLGPELLPGEVSLARITAGEDQGPNVADSLRS